MSDSRVQVRKPILLALCSLVAALMLVGVISTTQAFADEQAAADAALVMQPGDTSAGAQESTSTIGTSASEVNDEPGMAEERGRGALRAPVSQPADGPAGAQKSAPAEGVDNLEPVVEVQPSATSAGAQESAPTEGTSLPDAVVETQPSATSAGAQESAPTEGASNPVATDASVAPASEALAAADDPLSYEESHVNMYRLYNPNSGEHFYTSSLFEAQSVATAGWQWEGIGWVAPTENEHPVFRLYNPNAGDHHYTLSEVERDDLVAKGWNYEGVGWYSDAEDQAAIFRQYNPNAVAGAHNFTKSSFEDEYLGKVGWNREGIAWYATDGENIAIDGFWLVTSAWGSLHRYWIGTDAQVVKGRFIDASEGAGWDAYATPEGFVVTGKWDNGAGRVYVADAKGELASTADGNDGWIVTDAYDGGFQRYYYDASARAMVTSFFEVDGAKYYGLGGFGYVLRNDYVQDQLGGGQWYHADAASGVLTPCDPPAYAAMTAMAQGYSSGTGYLMMIDNDTCHVGVFTGSEGNWQLLYYWDCANGRDDSPTPRGIYYIGSKGYSFGDDDHTCFYYSQITGNYLFHSILYEPYQSSPRDDNIKFGGLGGHYSNGCVRLATDNAYWVYSNIPGGTKIVSYN